MNCLPHSHPKEVLPERHTESGPSSTVLSPHSSHTRTTLLEEPFTFQTPSSVVPATANYLARPGVGTDLTSSELLCSVAWLRAYMPPTLVDKV